jgi:hypothetical protein
VPPIPGHIRRQRLVTLAALALAAVAVLAVMAWTISWLWP